MYHLVSLRSLLAEKDERMFGDLRTMDKHTCLPHPGCVIAKCLTKYGVKQLLTTTQGYQASSFETQDSLISKKAKKLPSPECSEFSTEFITKHPTLWQAHLERLGDCLLLGEGVWWETSSLGVRFLDVDLSNTSKPKGPPLHHFRRYTLSAEKKYLSVCWKNVVERVEAGSIHIPAKKIKVYQGDLSRTITINQPGKI